MHSHVNPSDRHTTPTIQRNKMLNERNKVNPTIKAALNKMKPQNTVALAEKNKTFLAKSVTTIYLESTQ